MRRAAQTCRLWQRGASRRLSCGRGHAATRGEGFVDYEKAFRTRSGAHAGSQGFGPRRRGWESKPRARLGVATLQLRCRRDARLTIKSSRTAFRGASKCLVCTRNHCLCSRPTPRSRTRSESLQLTPVAACPQREHPNTAQMDAETRGVVVDAVSGFIAGAACTLVFQPLDTILVRQQYVGSTTMESAVAVLKAGRQPRVLARRHPTNRLSPVPERAAHGGLRRGRTVGQEARGGGVLRRRYSSEAVWKSTSESLWWTSTPSSRCSRIDSVGRLKFDVHTQVAAVRVDWPSRSSRLARSSSPRSGRQLFGPPPYDWRLATRGLHATFHRDVIPHGVWFWVYDRCKRTYGDDGMATMASGAVAAAVAWVVGYPADV